MLIRDKLCITSLLFAVIFIHKNRKSRHARNLFKKKKKGRRRVCHSGFVPDAKALGVIQACVCSVAPLCQTLCGHMDCSPPNSSVHGILQARILEWVAISFSKGSSLTQGLNLCLYVSCIGRQILHH